MPKRIAAQPAAARREPYVEQVMEGPDGRAQTVLVNLSESPLAWLHARGKLSRRLFLAGDKLRADWERAGLGPKVTMVWDAAPPSRTPRGSPAGRDAGAAQLSAKQRFDGAIAAAGPGLSDILWRVACAGEGLSAAEQALGWPVRAGKLVLTLALERVAVFYRIE